MLLTYTVPRNLRVQKTGEKLNESTILTIEIMTDDQHLLRAALVMGEHLIPAGRLCVYTIQCYT